MIARTILIGVKDPPLVKAMNAGIASAAGSKAMLVTRRKTRKIPTPPKPRAAAHNNKEKAKTVNHTVIKPTPTSTSGIKIVRKRGDSSARIISRF